MILKKIETSRVDFTTSIITTSSLQLNKQFQFTISISKLQKATDIFSTPLQSKTEYVASMLEYGSYQRLNITKTLPFRSDQLQ